jgi:hypothetical protein
MVAIELLFLFGPQHKPIGFLGSSLFERRAAIAFVI